MNELEETISPYTKALVRDRVRGRHTSRKQRLLEDRMLLFSSVDRRRRRSNHRHRLGIDEIQVDTGKVRPKMTAPRLIARQYALSCSRVGCILHPQSSQNRFHSFHVRIRANQIVTRGVRVSESMIGGSLVKPEIRRQAIKLWHTLEAWSSPSNSALRCCRRFI